MDVVSSTPVSLWIDFEAPQGLVIPDVGRTSYSLYDGAGVPLAVNQVLTPAAEATGVSVPILAINNVIDEGEGFERRIVHVIWESGGQSYSIRRSYRVVNLPLYTTTTKDVRDYLSLNEDELREDEVDIFAAWAGLTSEVEGFTAALASSGLRGLRAERAIMLTAAVSLFPSLRYRIAQSTTDGSVKFERVRDPKAFEALAEATYAELLSITRQITGDTSANTIAPVLIRLGTVALDPVTGAAPATGG